MSYDEFQTLISKFFEIEDLLETEIQNVKYSELIFGTNSLQVSENTTLYKKLIIEQNKIKTQIDSFWRKSN